MSNVVSLNAQQRAGASKFIYIAAPFTARERARELKDMVEAAGHVSTASWIPSHLSDYDNLSATQLLTEAKHDALGVRRSDIIVLINNEGPSTSGGMHVEFGLALAYGKGVIIVGEKTNLFHYFDKIVFAPSINEVVDRIGRVIETAKGEAQ